MSFIKFLHCNALIDLFCSNGRETYTIAGVFLLQGSHGLEERLEKEIAERLKVSQI